MVRSNVNMVMCLTVFYLTAFAVDSVVFRTVLYPFVVWWLVFRTSVTDFAYMCDLSLCDPMQLKI